MTGRCTLLEIKVVTHQKFRQFWPYSCGTVVNVNFNHPCVINQYFAQHFSIHWKKNHLIGDLIKNDEKWQFSTRYSAITKVTIDFSN